MKPSARASRANGHARLPDAPPAPAGNIPTPERELHPMERLNLALANQRNEAMGRCAMLEAELGATQDALKKAEARIAELTKE